VALAAAIERAEAESAAPDCQWILVDGGDEFQGGWRRISRTAARCPTAPVGDTAAALGNHEFDWDRHAPRVDARRALRRPRRQCALHRRTRRSVIRDHTIVTRGPFTIGIIGIITRSTETAAKASVTDLLRLSRRSS
jgi:2',3'-cyclic-nucleotide 2'-phosphodiesterase (5'-nucleotidase family)